MKKILKTMGIIISVVITMFGISGFIKTGINLKQAKDYHNKYIL